MDKKKKILISTAAVLGVLLSLYIGFSVYFMSHFFLGTTINNVKVSGKSVSEAKAELEKHMETYEITIVERDGTKDAIGATEIGLKVEWENQVEGILESQNGFSWIGKVFAPDAYEKELAISFDETKLQEVINGLSCMTAEKQIEPINAGISEYTAENKYELVPSIPGTAINREVFDSCLRESIYTLKNELVLEDALCYNQPVIGDDNEQLLGAIQTLNTCVSTVLTYQVGSETQVLDASTFEPWLIVGEDFSITLDDAALTEYVKSLESTYNTYSKPKSFKTSYGETVTVKIKVK